MFALIRTYEGLSVENLDEATRKANAGLRTILQESPGFVSYELLKHEGTDGKVASISVFDSAEHAEESTKVASTWIREEKLEAVLPNAPKVTSGEVVVEKTS